WGAFWCDFAVVYLAGTKLAAKWRRLGGGEEIIHGAAQTTDLDGIARRAVRAGRIVRARRRHFLRYRLAVSRPQVPSGHLLADGLRSGDRCPRGGGGGGGRKRGGRYN